MRVLIIVVLLTTGFGLACNGGSAEKPDDEQTEATTTDESAESAEEMADDEEAADEESDDGDAMAGEVQVMPLQHGSFMLLWNGRAIAVDPVTGALEAHEGDEPKADLILLTDIHGDHLDPEAVATIRKPDSIVIAPQAVVDKAGDALPESRVMANGDTATLMDGAVTVEATPMYNLERTRPDSGEPFHVKGRGNGYLLTLGDKRVYISGDTECTPEMKALEDIDIAFVCMNLPYTMPVEEAAMCIREFQPKVVYPFHFRGQDPSRLDGLLGEDSSTDVRLLDWYPGTE